MPIQAGQPIKASEVVDEFNKKENISNKKDTINNNATEYPSSKAVYSVINTINTSISAKQDKIPAGTANSIVAYSGTSGTFGALTRVTSVGATGSDTALPTEKAVRSAISTAVAAIPAPDLSSYVTSTALNTALNGFRKRSGLGFSCSTSLDATKITWYAAVKLCIEKTAGTSGLATKMSAMGFSSSMSTANYDAYLRWAMNEEGAYRLLTEMEWRYAYDNGMISSHSQYEWCAGLYSYGSTTRVLRRCTDLSNRGIASPSDGDNSGGAYYGFRFARTA